jgi:hypothetical protein
MGNTCNNIHCSKALTDFNQMNTIHLGDEYNNKHSNHESINTKK